MSNSAPPDAAAPECIHPEREYQQFLAANRLMLLRSRTSGQLFFFPRVAEPRTGRTDLEWVEATGMGTVYSTTVVRCKPPAADYNVALIDLAEGPRVMSRVEGLTPEDVQIGQRVQAKIIHDNDRSVLVFEPAP